MDKGWKMEGKWIEKYGKGCIVLLRTASSHQDIIKNQPAL
jgi:hypothetical protein